MKRRRRQSATLITCAHHAYISIGLSNRSSAASTKYAHPRGTLDFEGVSKDSLSITIFASPF